MLLSITIKYDQGILAKNNRFKQNGLKSTNRNPKMFR